MGMPPLTAIFSVRLRGFLFESNIAILRHNLQNLEKWQRKNYLLLQPSAGI